MTREPETFPSSLLFLILPHPLSRLYRRAPLVTLSQPTPRTRFNAILIRCPTADLLRAGINERDPVVPHARSARIDFRYCDSLRARWFTISHWNYLSIARRSKFVLNYRIVLKTARMSYFIIRCKNPHSLFAPSVRGIYFIPRQNSFWKKRCMLFFSLPAKVFSRARKSTSHEKKRGGIHVYNWNSGVSRGDFAAKKGEERVWLAAAKLAENRGEFTSMHTTLATMRNIIKARRDERYWSVSKRDTNGKWNHYTANASVRSMNARKWRTENSSQSISQFFLKDPCNFVRTYN